MSTARLTTFGHWGDLSRQPFVFDINSLDLARKSLLAMGHGQSAATREAQPYWRGVRRLFEGEGAPLCLTWNRSFPAAWNSLAAWSGPAQYFRERPGAFGGDAMALAHERSALTQDAGYTSAFPIERNQPFAARLWVSKPLKDATAPVAELRWDRWLLQAWPGSVSLARLAPSWTRAAQDDVDLLIGEMEADSDAGYEAAIDEFRNAHYEAFESLSGSLNLDEGAFIDLDIVPEPLGALNVFVLNTKSRPGHTRITIPALIEATDNAPDDEQTIYATGPLNSRTKGPDFIWQIGKHLHSNAINQDDDGHPYGGEIICPTPIYVETADDMGGELSDLTSRLRASTPAGSKVLRATRDAGNYGYNDDGSPNTVHKFELSLRLCAPDNRYTPFLYSGQLILPARPHVGETSEQSYDSDDHRLKAGGVPIASVFHDVLMEVEGATWARRYTVVLNDVEGAALPNRRSYEALENRMASLQVDGEYVLRNGIVGSAERGEMRTVIPNQPTGASIANTTSQAVLPVSDGWFLLDEKEDMEPLILDGQKPGENAHLVLRNEGWSANEVSHVRRDFGIEIPTARLDEEPLERAEGSPGSVLRSMFEDWGMGAFLVPDVDGKWSIQEPGADPVLELSARASVKSRRLIYGKLDYSRDFAQCFNEIIVVGGENWRGEKLSRVWSLRDGWRWQADANQRFIGRRKRKVIHKPKLRRRDDIDRCGRSNVLRWGKPGRFISCEIHCFLWLRPGHAVLIDGQRYHVERIGGASLRNDRMQVVFNEDVQALTGAGG